jgi:thiol-disulfide isomerase/thioredoxin
MRAFSVRSWKDVLMVTVLIAAAVGFYLFYVRSHARGPEVPRAGLQAPDFTLPTLNGDQVSLSDHRGKVVFVNFWATWCLRRENLRCLP